MSYWRNWLGFGLTFVCIALLFAWMEYGPSVLIFVPAVASAFFALWFPLRGLAEAFSWSEKERSTIWMFCAAQAAAIIVVMALNLS